MHHREAVTLALQAQLGVVYRARSVSCEDELQIDAAILGECERAEAAQGEHGNEG